MSVSMPKTVYIMYAVIVLLGVIAAVIYLIGRLKKQRRKTDGGSGGKSIKMHLLFGIGMLACLFVPLVMSIYRSATHDMQFQGRYIMSGLPVLAYVMTVGFDEITAVLSAKKKWLRFDILVGILWTSLFLFSYFGYIF